MDDSWERSIPLLSIDKATASYLFGRFDPKGQVVSLEPLTEGKRNTNYRVSTTSKDQTYLLRVFPDGEDSWRKEKSLRALLHGRVPMQTLYFIGRDEAIDNRVYAIYSFVEGRSLLELMVRGYVPEKELLRQIGSLLANIHSHRYGMHGFLDDKLGVALVIPPLEEWFGMFLNPLARERLGAEMSAAIERLVHENIDTLREIDRSRSLIHGDFRPTNLLISQGKVSCVLDWEFAMAGHPIADLAQFFRYEDKFTMEQKESFIRAYIDGTGLALPANWENMGRLRDLANLLQMISADHNQPVKYADLKRLIGKTLQHLKV